MELSQDLLSLKKSNRNWEVLFSDGKKLLSKVKKKDPVLEKAQRSLFRAFLEADGNNRLLQVKDEPYTRQDEEVNAIAKELSENGANYNKAKRLAWQFMNVCTNHYENMETSRRLEKISQEIFARNIKEDRRFELLSKSHNPFELYELGEISLKTEDFYDVAKADEFYRKAAQEGISDGLFTMGLFYELDEKDYDKAKSYYEDLLADQNPKGYTGLAILALDSSKENPYYNPEKAREYAREGMDARCGTSMFVYADFLMEENKPEAFNYALLSSEFDANLEAQLKMSNAFVASIFKNLQRNFAAFAKAGKDMMNLYSRDLVIYLYASKYNMTDNFGRFLQSLEKLVLAIKAYYKKEDYSEKYILTHLGINLDLLHALASQYSSLDEKTQNELDTIKKWFA